MNFKQICLATGLVLVSYSVNADYAKGKKAYDEGNFIIALQEFKKSALKGDLGSQYFLGSMYLGGEAGYKSEREGLELIRKAAEQGYAPAQALLGGKYSFGLNGVKKSDFEAVKWYRKAAEQGHASAQYALAVNYYFGQGVRQSYQEAFKWYSKSAENGYVFAYDSLAEMYEEGLGVKKSYSKAKEWWGKACDTRSERGCERYATLNKMQSLD